MSTFIELSRHVERKKKLTRNKAPIAAGVAGIADFTTISFLTSQRDCPIIVGSANKLFSLREKSVYYEELNVIYVRLYSLEKIFSFSEIQAD